MNNENRKLPYCNYPDHVGILPEIKNLKNEIKELCKLIKGNGDPQGSLIFKVERNTLHRKWIERFGWMVLTAAVGVPFTVIVIFVSTRM